MSLDTIHSKPAPHLFCGPLPEIYKKGNMTASTIKVHGLQAHMGLFEIWAGKLCGFKGVGVVGIQLRMALKYNSA